MFLIPEKYHAISTKNLKFFYSQLLVNPSRDLIFPKVVDRLQNVKIIGSLFIYIIIIIKKYIIYNFKYIYIYLNYMIEVKIYSRRKHFIFNILEKYHAIFTQLNT